MSFAWEDYLELAEGLYENPTVLGPEEATLRTATSRAYYAAFQCAFEFACDETFNPTRRAEDHSRIRAYFRERPLNSNDSKKISALLDRIGDNRRQVDYDAVLKTSARNLAYFTIQTAKQVLEILDHL